MTIDCATCESRMESYVNGTLDDGNRAEMAGHVDHCEQCREVLKSEYALREALRSLPVMACPDTVLETIRKETIDAEAGLGKRLVSWPKWFYGWRVPAAVTACLVVLLLLGRPLMFDSQDTSVYYPGDGLEARTLAMLSLVYVAQTIQESEERAFDEVFSGEIPQKVHRIIREEVPLFGGKSL